MPSCVVIVIGLIGGRAEFGFKIDQAAFDGVPERGLGVEFKSHADSVESAGRGAADIAGPENVAVAGEYFIESGIVVENAVGLQ